MRTNLETKDNPWCLFVCLFNYFFHSLILLLVITIFILFFHFFNMPGFREGMHSMHSETYSNQDFRSAPLIAFLICQNLWLKFFGILVSSIGLQLHCNSILTNKTLLKKYNLQIKKQFMNISIILCRISSNVPVSVALLRRHPSYMSTVTREELCSCELSFSKTQYHNALLCIIAYWHGIYQIYMHIDLLKKWLLQWSCQGQEANEWIYC